MSLSYLQSTSSLPCVTRTGTTGRWHPHANKIKTTLTNPHANAAVSHTIVGLPPVDDQLSIGSCVFQSVRGAVWILANQNGDTREPLSQLHLYWIDRVRQGNENEDCGGFSETAIESARTIGACRDSLWPYSEEGFMRDGIAVRPSIDALRDASDRRISQLSWFSCPTLVDVESALHVDHPIIFGTAVDSTIQSYRPGQVLGAPNPRDIIGGHEMVIVGVDYEHGPRRWLIRNSWGAGYGENGHLWVSDAFLTNPSAGGFYALTRNDR